MLFQQARLSLGLTQEEVAGLVRARLQPVGKGPAGFDANTVSRIECGRIRWPGAQTRTALRAVLEVATDAELGLHGARAPQTTGQEVRTTKRRTFLSLPLGAALPDLLHAPTRPGADDVRDIVERTRSLEEWDRRSGGRSTRHFAAMELQRVLELQSVSMTPTVRTAWYGALAALAGLTAWTTFDAGLTGAASVFNLGLDAAREANDASTYCHIATNAARQAVHEGDAERALGLTASVTGPHSPSILAMVAAVTA
ncbi:helix-turn-helix domain-containing protein [Kitasatospora indigofera]|uniref:helix-turn-helix domain-containing protein n=1 Tax=Kitasatospora indigofera TaxID=67307 RepID=UPI0033BF7A06